MKIIRHTLTTLTLGLVLCASGAFAQGFSSGSSSANTVAYFKPEQIVSFSKKVERAMGESGARVAIIARMGRPASELPEGMHFTHVAFAVYSQITTATGEKVNGYAIQNLYQQDAHPDVSDLVQDFPVDFFSGAAALEAGLIIPSPELQARLLNVIASPIYKKLHVPRYSVIANPYTVERQNCTEFVLDVVNSAIYQTSDIQVIKANEKAYFKAQPVNVNPFKLMLGSMFSAEVAMVDHNGPPVTATYERIGDYLQKYDTGSYMKTVYAD